MVESGKSVSGVFREMVEKDVANASFQTKKALDPYDVLAFAKKFINLDHVVIFVELEREKKEENEAFFDGLADLEVDTGKNIFKCIYYDDESGEDTAKVTAEKFLEYAYGKAPSEEKKEEF